MIKFHCSHCKQKLGVPDSYAGRRIRCNICSKTSIVPKLACGTAAPGGAANSDSSGDDLLTAQDLFAPKISAPDRAAATDHREVDGRNAADNTISSADGELKLKLSDPPPPPSPEEEEIRLASIKRSQQQSEEPVEIIDFPDDRIVENPPGYWPFTFPLRGPGLGMIGIFTGGMALTIAARVFRLSRWGRYRHHRLSFFFTAIIGGYFCWYLNQCIQTTATGKISSPEVLYESEGDRMDLFLQIARMFLTIAVSQSVTISYCIWLALTYGISGMSFLTDIVFWSLTAGGLFFLPMMILSVILHDSATALNPILIIDSIRRTAAQYFVLVLCVLPLLGLAAMIPLFLYRFGIWFIIPGTAFSIYFLMVTAAILGRFFYRNEKILDWEV